MAVLLVLAGLCLGVSGEGLPSDEVALLQSRLAASEGGGEESIPFPQTSKFRQGLRNQGDAQYVANIRVGTISVPTYIQSIFNTTMTGLLAVSKECQGCGDYAVYDLSNSISRTAGLNEPEDGITQIAHVYRSGTEEIAIGPYRFLPQASWEMLAPTFPNMNGVRFGAVVGLAPSGMRTDTATEAANPDIAPKVLPLSPKAQRIIAANPLAAPTTTTAPVVNKNRWNMNSFSIAYHLKAAEDGIIVWNDNIYSEFPGDFKSMPLRDATSWDVTLKNVFFSDINGNNQTNDIFCEGGCRAILDSSSSILVVPQTLFLKVNESWSGVLANCSNLNDVLPILRLSFGNAWVTIHPSDYVGVVTDPVPSFLNVNLPDMDNSKSCSLMLGNSAIFFGQGVDAFVLGVPWFRRFYTTFVMGDEMTSRSVQVAKHFNYDMNPVDWSLIPDQFPQPEVAIRQVEASLLRLPVPQAIDFQVPR